MKLKYWLIGLVGWCVGVSAQNIPVSLEYTRVYDFLDELATDGIIHSMSEAVRPFTRVQIANMLVEAQSADSLMNKRQKDDLAFYLNEFSLERDTMREGYVQYTDHKTYNLSLADPQFSYMTKNKKFKMQIKPLLGAEVIGSKKGAIVKRWYGAEIQMDIVNHISIWGSLRDISYNGKWFLKDKYFPTSHDKMMGARLAKPSYLNNRLGLEYKESNDGGDFSDSKGGINVYAWFGSIGVSRENIRWGDAYHASNILSGRNPAVPQLTLQLTPVWWFQFDYFHAWLISNVLNDEDYYVEKERVDPITGGYVLHNETRPRSKYMAANMFTFKPCKWVHFGFGNSIVYAENNPQAAYFIPFAFYKSLDHLLTKGNNSENQNSQVFFTLTVRPVDHLKLYGSCYVDEVNWKRLKKDDPKDPVTTQKNPVSYLVGFDWTGWPIKGLSLKGEFMRSYIACYTHSIDVLEYTSNSYNMGHYMGDNAQSIFVELSYRPYKGMLLQLSYTNDTKYNQYYYIRELIGKTIAEKPFGKKIYQNDQVDLKFTYEVHPNMYLIAGLSYNYARAFDNKGGKNAPYVDGTTAEQYGDAGYYLDKFCPEFYQGKNFSANIGFSFGF
ncbi:MAG: capsule assembly Wzi family protein [Paludibacteraceae bacterium]|nr:capsule assembly Wzi family protein [Paludibacteraceae bacterium]